MKRVSAIGHRETTSGFSAGSRRGRSWTRFALGDDAPRIPVGVWLAISLLVLLLVSGCGGGTDAGSIDTESLTAEDLAGLVPDAETAGAVLGVTIEQADERSGISDGFGQGFEHADDEVIEDLRDASGYMSFYRGARESDQNIPKVSTDIQLVLFETAGAAEGAMEVLTGELEVSDPSQFDVSDLADASRGFIFDDHPPVSTWTLLRWDSLLAMIVTRHPPEDPDPVESARSLVEQLRTNLVTGEQGG